MSRPIGRARGAMGLLAVLIVSTACGSGTPATPSPAPIAGPEFTPWQSEILNLERDGTRSLESALTLFAMAFGPVPGVAATPAEAGTVGSASPAVRAIRAHREELTDEQQAAIDQYLAAPDDATTLDIPPASTSISPSLRGALAVTGGMVAADPFERDLIQLGVQARRAAAPYFGDIPALSVRFINSEGAPFVSFFNPTFGPGGFEKCDVFVNTAAASLGISEIGRGFTLDVIHCFQSWRMGSEQGFDRAVPAWAWEGAAEYIMLEAWPVQEDDALYWATYLLLPDVPLFERAYDAYPYYAQARDAGVDLGAAFVAVLTDVDDPERFALAGTTSNQFLDKWASELVRSANGDWGPDWTFVAPGPSGPTPATPQQAMSVANGSLEAFSQDAYSNHLFAMHSSADIVEIEAFGRVRVGDGTVDAVIPGSAAFCTTDKGCGPCPDGSDPSIQPTPLSADSIIAVSGGTDGTNGTVSGHPLEEYCEPPTPSFPTPEPTGTPSPTAPPPPDSCDSGGCPMSNGDVHIVTIDNHGYDFQAVGEFVLLRTANGAFEIQGRQEPYGGSNDVSINSAIAMTAGGHRIGVYADPSRTDALSVLVDGAPVDPVTGPVTVGDARITHVGGMVPGLEVAYSDGTRISLVGQIQYGINLVINPSEQVRAGAVGLMGPVSGDSSLPALADGTVIPEQFGIDAYYEQLYGVFEESWRVTAATTLFDYTEGRTTESYVDPDFPALDHLATIDELTPEQIAAGEAACASILIEFLRQQCIYDVAVTGVDIFGDLYDITAEIVDKGTIVPAGQRVRIVNVFWDPVTGAVPLDVYAWTDAGPALITTVKYGEVTEFFDPGSWTDSFGTLEALVSLQPSGQPVVDEAFNWADLAMDIDPGLQRTYVVGTEKPDPLFGGGFTPTVSSHDEKGGPYPMLNAPPDRGLLFLDINALVDTHDPVAFYMSAGDGCLTQPDFPTLAQASSVGDNSYGYQGPLAVAPGTNLELTLHEAKQEDDPFQVRCDTQPIAGPVPFSLEAGQRSHLILYSIPGDPAIRSLILPFGE